MVSWGSGTHPLAIRSDPCHIKSMKETKADLPLILADYTEFVNQQQRRFEAIRAQSDVAGSTEIMTPDPEPQQQWFAKWEATRPQGQWGRWHISDRD